MPLDAKQQAFVQKVIGTYNSHDVDEFDALLTDDCVLVRNGVEASGKKAIKQVMAKLFRAFPDIEYEIDDVLVADDKLALRWRGHGTHKGDYFGIAPTNREASYDGITMYQLHGDKIAAIWVSTNIFGLLRDLGAKATIPSKPEARA
jgi:steroid delta-isomerase-like uncharacterized protein